MTKFRKLFNKLFKVPSPMMAESIEKQKIDLLKTKVKETNNLILELSKENITIECNVDLLLNSIQYNFVPAINIKIYKEQ